MNNLVCGDLMLYVVPLQSRPRLVSPFHCEWAFSFLSCKQCQPAGMRILVRTSRVHTLLQGVQPVGPVGPRMAVSAAQHKIIHLLKTSFFLIDFC